MLAWVGRFLMKDIQVFLTLGSCLINFLSFRLIAITSSHVVQGCPLSKYLITLNVLYLLDQALSSIPFRKPNHCSLLSCRHCLMVFSFNLVLSSSAYILCSSLTLHFYVTLTASFLSSLITSSSLAGQSSLP